MLPDGTKLITFPVIDDCNNARAKKEWIMNPNGKSYVCILHEYVQHALKKQPVYDFKELENAATPYSATVSINDLKYGIGFGTSKKQAKSEAARETLEILIPEMRDKISSEKKAKGQSIFKDLSVFDEIRIEDPRVNEFCTKTTEPSPHAILQTCLQRNFGLGDAKIEYHVNPVRNKRNEFTITVGKHKATVICRNKRDGKQRASQAILQVRTFGYRTSQSTCILFTFIPSNNMILFCFSTSDSASTYQNLGLTVAPIRQRFGQIVQGEETRGTRNYGVAKQSGYKSTELCHFR